MTAIIVTTFNPMSRSIGPHQETKSLKVLGAPTMKSQFRVCEFHGKRLAQEALKGVVVVVHEHVRNLVAAAHHGTGRGLQEPGWVEEDLLFATGSERLDEKEYIV